MTDMDPVETHLARVLAAIRPVEPVRLGLEAAEGTVLAADAGAVTPLPSFDNSSMDGYAVHAADIAAATAEAPVILPVTDQVPAGADAVVPVELTDGGSDRARFFGPVVKGYSIRRRGDDVAPGDVLLPAGTRLGPAQIALLAASGHGSVLARAAPKVAVLATGNELSEPGSPLVPGQIWESNSYMLAAAVRQAGGSATRHRAGDDPEKVLALIGVLSAQADLLITSGGVSMGGEHDVVKAALSGSRAGTITFCKVAMQPGMPQGFGVVGPDQTPILTLPGNPVSAFVSFWLFGRPALDALQGLVPPPVPARRAQLASPVRSPQGRRSFLRGVLNADGATVTPLTGQGSHQLGALARANALIVVPEEVASMAAGDEADVISLL